MPDLPHRHSSLTRGMSKSRRLAIERLTHHRIAGEFHPDDDWDVREKIPEAWLTLEQDVDVFEPKTKVTLWLDQSVAKFFRAQGKGWHNRANRVLATYAQMKIAEVNVGRRLVAEFKAELRAKDAEGGD